MAAAARRRSRRASTVREGEQLTSEKRVLLLDDDEDLRDLYTRALRGAGFVVDPVKLVATASACLNGMRYDLVIADWRLPDGEGLTVADQAASLGAKTIIYSSYQIAS